MKKRNIVLSVLVLIAIVLLIINPQNNMNACLTGIQVWATSVLPALFPFFFFTKMLTELGFVEKLSSGIAPITKKLFHTPGISGYIYLMSILSGYPVGAKLTADFYEKNLISYGQARRIITFTSTSGPLFIIGTVGIGMFVNKTVGFIILISHFLGAILNGLVYRNVGYKKEKETPIKLLSSPPNNMLEECMLGSIKSIFIVGGYVAIFFMVITMLNSYYILTPFNKLLEIITFHQIPSGAIQGFTNGIIELTRGCLDLSKVANGNLKMLTILASALVSFGGFSIHAQAFTFLKKINIKFSFYITQKITHTILSTIIAIPLAILWL